jgi:hypothetical protein
MKPAAFALALLTTSAASCAHDLSSMLGTSLRVIGSANNARIEYCPDNTCEAFALRDKAAKRTLEEFAAVYFFGISEYVYLRELQQSAPPDFISAVLERHRRACPAVQARKAARCVAAHIATQHRIRGTFVRYDEGRRVTAPIPLSNLDTPSQAANNGT